MRDQALAICGSTSSDQREELKATSIETLRQMVAAGVGCTLLPQLAAIAGRRLDRQRHGPGPLVRAARADAHDRARLAASLSARGDDSRPGRADSREPAGRDRSAACRLDDRVTRRMVRAGRSPGPTVRRWIASPVCNSSSASSRPARSARLRRSSASRSRPRPSTSLRSKPGSARGCCTARRAASRRPRSARCTTRSARRSQRELDEADNLAALLQARRRWALARQHVGGVRPARADAAGARFMRSIPKSTIDLSFDDRYVNLVEQGIDVAIRMGRLADSTARCALPRHQSMGDGGRPTTWRARGRRACRPT